MAPVAGIAILVLLAVAGGLRGVALRRLGSDPRAGSLVLLSTLLIVLSGAGIGAWLAFRSPLPGAVMVVGVLLVGGLWLRSTLDRVRGTPTPGRRPDAALDRTLERMERSYRALSASLLGLGFVGLVGLAMWLFARMRF